MKIHKNQTLQFSPLSWPWGTWKSTKKGRFIFLQFSWPRVHENSQKSDLGRRKLKKIEASDFCGFSCTRGHENWIKSMRLIFVNSHVPGVMKVEENRSIWFLWIFMYPGSWKLKKIKVSDFCGFSCTRGSWKLKKIEASGFCGFSCTPGVMKIKENQSVWFLWIFMYPGSWKLKKIEASDFCGFSCTWGHESWRKSKSLIFVNFHVPRVMKIGQNWSV